MAIQTYIITRKQSLLDACIQVYGTSKLLFQFAKDNGLYIDSSVNIGDSFIYDDELGDQDLKNKIEGEGFIINNPGLPVLQFPTANLIGQYSQEAEGEDLIDFFGGVSIPYVSGAGNDQIFDFSVLNSDNFNKNAYLGNAFALPEYYDFPYQAEIYFDTLNPYYWKLIDFHYRFITTQLLAFKDRFLAKITYEATVLQQVDELLLYSIDQTGEGLEVLKNYIEILPTYIGGELVTNGSFDSDSNWGKGAGWTIFGGSANVIALATTNLQQNIGVSVGNYETSITVISISPGFLRVFIGATSFGQQILTPGVYKEIISYGAPTSFIFIQASGTTIASIDDVSVKQIFENYYKNEA